MAGWLFASIADVDLRPDQKPLVDAIEADLRKAGDPAKDAEKQLTSDVADGVAAGKIDKAKTDADVKHVSDAAASTATSVQDAINRLHKTLDPAQRKKLVDSMQAKAEEGHEHGPGEHGPGGEHGGPGEHEHGPGGEHGGPGEHEHGPGEHGDHGPGEHGMGPDMGGEKLADDLGLTPEQRDKLHAKMKDMMKAHMGEMKTKMEAMHAHMKAMGTAFEGETFDAKKAGVGDHGPEMAKDMAHGRIQMAETVLAILTPEQRAKFAEHIRAHAEEGE
jgi:Spy/CpxP family protein refolding chaperone